LKNTTGLTSTLRSLLALSGLFLAACLGVGACSDGTTAEDVAAGASEALAGKGVSPGAHEVIFARVYYKDVADLERMASALDLLESADRAAGWVDALLDPERYADLTERGYRVDILSRETPGTPQAFSSSSGVPGYPCYRSVEETQASMRAIAADHPDLARVVDIGDSWTKVTSGGGEGYDLLVLELTNSAVPGPKPAFFLMGAIHAREYVTAETALRFAVQMVNGYGTDPDATWLLDNYELHVLPQANPDGRKLAEQGYYQRKNLDDSGGGCWGPPTGSSQTGTDLNRNSSYRWGGAGATTAPCDQMYRGKSAASEPETKAIQSYLASIFPDQRGPKDTDAVPSDASGLFLSLHSYGPFVLYPWAWTAAGSPNGAQLATLGRKFGYFNGYPVCQPSTCLYAASGSTDDWTYGVLGVASFTFEMGTTFFQSCSSYESTVAPNNLPAILYAFKAARRPYQAPAGPDSLGVSVSASVVKAGAMVTLTANADDTRYASNGNGIEPTQSIVGARYSVGGPSWAAGVTTVAMSAADGAFNARKEGVIAQVATEGWAVGRHLIAVESQDAAGNWGVPSAVFLDIE
jgi:carboxypeptidase T